MNWVELCILSFICGILLGLVKITIKALYSRIKDPNEPIRRNAIYRTPCDIRGPQNVPIVWSEEHNRYVNISEIEEKKIEIKPKKELTKHNFTGLP